MTIKKLTTPLKDRELGSLRAGDRVLISGKIFTARDAAHKKMDDLIRAGKKLPINLRGQVIYYCGPTPAKPGRAIGSAGPTTSKRMDEFTPPLFKLGLKATIGKGKRGTIVRLSQKKSGSVYFVATGGAGALLSQSIKKAKVIAYPELGPEAIYELEVKDFPVIVGNDLKGRDIFEEGIKKYKVK